MLRPRKKRGSSLGFLLVPACGLGAVLALFTAVSNLENGQSAEARQQLEDSIHRAVVSCYAAEGFYPPTLSYLEEHYGIQIDEDRFTVFYDIFADNLMPDITVLNTGEGVS